MSQTIPKPAPQTAPADFDYRPVPVLAPVALVLGLCSAIGLLGVFGMTIAVLGAIIGGIAVLNIRRSDGELGGMWLAVGGWTLSILFLVTSAGLHSYAYATELPEGHIRVHFPSEISAKQFVVENNRRRLHPDVEPLVGKKIFIKGYMWDQQQTTGLSSFVLLKDNGQCCFGGDPAPWDMILVELQKAETDYIPGLVSVAGTLQADPNAGYGQAVYRIEATQVGQAKTSF